MKRTSDAIRDASTRRAWLAGAAGVAGAAWLPGAVMAQTPAFPARALKLIVPFPPGGPTDIVARPLALMLSAVLQQQVVVDNKAGAGGSIAADVVAKSPPDGYNLLMGTVGTHAINPALYKKLPYDAVKDFTALGLAASAPVAAVVGAASAYASVADLIAAAKKQPGTIAFGSAGHGTPGHLTGELFASSNAVGQGGLGYSITYANSQLQTDYLFALVFTASVLGFSFFFLVVGLEWWFLHRWHESALKPDAE